MAKQIKLVYISGPMTGYPEFNYPAFDAAAAALRANGIDAINPAETAGGVTHLSRATFLRIDIGYVMAAEAVVLLPGWEGSRGAALEVMVADALDLPIFLYDGKGGLGRPVEIHGAKIDWRRAATDMPRGTGRLVPGGCGV